MPNTELKPGHHGHRLGPEHHDEVEHHVAGAYEAVAEPLGHHGHGHAPELLVLVEILTKDEGK